MSPKDKKAIIWIASVLGSLVISFFVGQSLPVLGSLVFLALIAYVATVIYAVLAKNPSAWFESLAQRSKKRAGWVVPLVMSVAFGSGSGLQSHQKDVLRKEVRDKAEITPVTAQQSKPKMQIMTEKERESIKKATDKIKEEELVRMALEAKARAQEAEKAMVRAEEVKIKEAEEVEPEKKEANEQANTWGSLPIPYSIVSEWAFPAGGSGKVIVIDPKYRNEKDMRSLGDTLRRDIEGEPHASFFIYDDERYAKMRRKGAPTQGKALEAYNRHLIGSFVGGEDIYHYVIMLEGLDTEESIRVEY